MSARAEKKVQEAVRAVEGAKAKVAWAESKVEEAEDEDEKVEEAEFAVNKAKAEVDWAKRKVAEAEAVGGGTNATLAGDKAEVVRIENQVKKVEAALNRRGWR